jgi:hypothetical protein
MVGKLQRTPFPTISDAPLYHLKKFLSVYFGLDVQPELLPQERHLANLFKTALHMFIIFG